MHRTSRHPYHEEPPQLDGIASPPVPEGRRDRQRERKERQRKQSRPSPQKREEETEQDEARRDEEQPRTRDRCRRPCMICTTDRETERGSKRDRELERVRKRGSKDNLHYFSRFFMPAPRTQASRTGNPCRRDCLSVSPWKSPCINSPFVEYGELEAINAHFHPIQTGDGLHFRSRRKPGSQLLYPLLHLPKNFIISNLTTNPLKNGLISQSAQARLKFRLSFVYKGIVSQEFRLDKTFSRVYI